MKLYDILQLKGLTNNRIRIIRHTLDRNAEIRKLVASGYFELYQAYQKANIFKDADYVIAFRALEGRKALLHGLYKVTQVQEVGELPKILEPIALIENWGAGPYYYYDLIKDDGLNDLEERLVIDWGNALVSWYQKNLDKTVVEILPKGYAKPFLGYEQVILMFDELEKIVKNPDANRQWKMMLSNVYGVYLILDTTNGQQYVGSAYGKEGIWGRWSDYVQTKHGGNKILMELLANDPLRYKKFQFSIINILPNSSLQEQVIQLEQITKEKLGSRAFGLNAN